MLVACIVVRFVSASLNCRDAWRPTIRVLIDIACPFVLMESASRFVYKLTFLKPGKILFAVTVAPVIIVRVLVVRIVVCSVPAGLICTDASRRTIGVPIDIACRFVLMESTSMLVCKLPPLVQPYSFVAGLPVAFLPVSCSGNDFSGEFSTAE